MPPITNANSEYRLGDISVGAWTDTQYPCLWLECLTESVDETVAVNFLNGKPEVDVKQRRPANGGLVDRLSAIAEELAQYEGLEIFREPLLEYCRRQAN